MIETDHAMDIGARQVQFVSDLSNSFVADESIAVNEGVQQLNQKFRLCVELMDDLGGNACVVFDGHSLCDPFFARINIEGSVAQETDKGHTELLGRLNSKTRRRTDRRE
jgi:hypothetical protein